MPFDINQLFFGFISQSTLEIATILFFISFIIWEIPKKIKELPEEYLKGVYPDNGRVADYLIFGLGTIAAVGLFTSERMEKIITMLKTPGITSFYIIVLAVVPIIIAAGFLKRSFQRLDRHESLGIFTIQTILDLFHTVFFITFSILILPITGYLIFRGKM